MPNAGTALSKRKPTPKRGKFVLSKRSAGGSKSAMEVAVRPETLISLASDKTTVAEVMEALGDLIASIDKDSRGGGFSVVVDSKGHPTVGPLVRYERVANIDSVARPAEGTFAEARARGRILAAEILARPEMLTAEEMGERLGISHVTVNARRQRNELLGLAGAKRGFKFPDWQVDDDGQAIEILPELFEFLGPNPWSVYRFLTQAHNALGGAAAKDVLRRGHVKRVLDLAESIARGDFS